MVAPDNKIWCAVIENDTVKYFTNVPKYSKKLPLTIERKPVKFMK